MTNNETTPTLFEVQCYATVDDVFNLDIKPRVVGPPCLFLQYAQRQAENDLLGCNGRWIEDNWRVNRQNGRIYFQRKADFGDRVSLFVIRMV